MLLVQPKAQRLALVDLIVAAAAYVGAKLHLYSNDYTPNANSVLADFTECVYTGYAAETVTWSAAFFDEHGHACSSGGEKLFDQTGATGDNCYGAFLTDTAGTTLLGAARLADPVPFVFLNAGDTLPLQIKLTADGGLVDRSPVP